MHGVNDKLDLRNQLEGLLQGIDGLEKALLESGESFRSLADFTPVGVYLNDAQGNAIYINKKCAELVGVPAEEALNFNWVPFLHPDDRERMVSAWEDAVKNSSKFHLEYRWVHSDGKVVWTLGEVTPIIGDKGKATLFIGTLTDITERKQVEEALQESESTFRKLFEGSSDAILLLDGSGVFVECNQAALDLLKMPKEQFILLQPFQISPEFQPDGRRSEDAALEMISKAFDQGRNRFDWTCVNSEGDEFIIEVSLVPIKIKGQTMLHNTWRDITERKQADESLRKAELKLRRTIENSTNLFYMHTADHILTYVSPQSREFFDCKPEDAMIRWSEFLTDNPINQEGFLTTQRAIDTGKRQPPYQVECIGKRGRKIWVEVNEAPIIENGRTVAISGTLTDITERKKAEEELYESEERFKALHEATFGGSIIHEKGLILECNQGLSDMTGYTYEELIGMDGLRLIESNSLDIVLKNIATGYTQRYEVEGVRKDGSVYPLSIRGKNTTYKGREVRVIELRDISEIKDAEKRLIESEAKHKAMVENIHDVIVIVGEDGNSRYISPNIKRWFGWEPGDILNTEPWQRIHLDDLSKVKDLFVKIIAGEHSQDTVEYRYQCKDGFYKWVGCRATHCLKDPFINGILITFRDISRRKKIQKEQERSAQLAALGTVAAGVAHEINNPIQGILNYASLIEKNASSSERIRKASSIIVQESQRIAGITKNLLTYSKDNRLEMTYFKVDQVIADALSLISTKIRNSGISLSVDIASDLPEVYWQFQSIQQVILNLVDNAAYALTMKDKNEEDKKVEIITDLLKRQDQEFIRIVVQDNGTGMSQETIDRALEAFFTTKPSAMGTGLGLSIINDIVTIHGGTVAIESEEGKFTIFTIELPVKSPQTVSEKELKIF